MMKYFPVLALLSLAFSCQQNSHSDQETATKNMTQHLGKDLQCEVKFLELQNEGDHVVVFTAPTMTIDLAQKGLQHTNFYYSNNQADYLSIRYIGAKKAFSKKDEVSSEIKYEDAGIITVVSHWSENVIDKRVSTAVDLRSGDIFINQEFDLAKRLSNITVSLNEPEDKKVNIDRVQLFCASRGSGPELDFMKDARGPL